jgi:hypothetical protein
VQRLQSINAMSPRLSSRAGAFMRLVGYEVRRSWAMMMRYRSETILSLLFLFALFFAGLLGSNAIADKSFSLGSGTDGFLIGFLCWALVVGGVSHIAHDIGEEAKTGTLEIIFTCSSGPFQLFVARGLAGFVVGLPTLVILGAVLAYTTSSPLHLRLEYLVPVIALDLTATGIGFSLGALTLIAKRTQTATAIAQIVVVLLMVTHFEQGRLHMALPVLPLAPAMAVLKNSIQHPNSLTVDAAGALLLNGILYAVIGGFMFSRAVRGARRRGSLSQH